MTTDTQPADTQRVTIPARDYQALCETRNAAWSYFHDTTRANADWLASALNASMDIGKSSPTPAASDSTPDAAAGQAGELDAIRGRLHAAEQEVYALCAGRHREGRNWTMCIPVLATDSDIVISAALNDIPKLIARCGCWMPREKRQDDEARRTARIANVRA